MSPYVFDICDTWYGKKQFDVLCLQKNWLLHDCVISLKLGHERVIRFYPRFF